MQSQVDCSAREDSRSVSQTGRASVSDGLRLPAGRGDMRKWGQKETGCRLGWSQNIWLPDSGGTQMNAFRDGVE